HVCGGYDGLERGQGERCHGYDNPPWCYCSREEFAGRLTQNRIGLYSHRLLCRCADGCTCAARGRRAAGCWCADRCNCCLCVKEHLGAVSVASPAYFTTRTVRPAEGDAQRSRKALRIWACSKPIGGTPGESYLLNRRIAIKPG